MGVRANGLPVVLGTSYHPSGLLKSYTTGNGTGPQVVTTIDQDANSLMARPAKISTSSATTNFDTGTYTYDGAGNIVTMGSPSLGTDTFSYDRVSRLTATTLYNGQGASLGTQGYVYDRWGNLTSTTGVNARSLTVNTSTNRLTVGGATYDARGNLQTINNGNGVETYAYDALDRMLTYQQGSNLWKYTYTGGGERLSKTAPAPSADTYFAFRDASLNLATEIQVTGVGTKVTRDNVFLGSLLVGTYQDCSANGVPGWQYYSSDHLGTPRLVTDASGATLDARKYWPYGEDAQVTLPTSAQRLRLAGMERDTNESATRFYAHARNFDYQATGRFLGVDLLDGSAEDPQSWNRFSYALANPVNLIDPFGLSPEIPEQSLVFNCADSSECGTGVVQYAFFGSSGVFRGGVFIPSGDLSTQEFRKVLGAAGDIRTDVANPETKHESTAWFSQTMREVADTVTALKYISPADLLSKRIVGEGFKAFADGYNPFGDPFAAAGDYDRTDPGRDISYLIGRLTFGAHATVILKAGVSRGAFLNSNRYLRIGWSRLGGRRVFRIGGKLIEKAFKRKAFDLWKGGPL